MGRLRSCVPAVVAHVVARDFRAILADPVRLTCWLAAISYWDRGYKPTNTRCCAIDARHTMRGPTAAGRHPRIQTPWVLFRRTNTFQ